MAHTWNTSKKRGGVNPSAFRGRDLSRTAGRTTVGAPPRVLKSTTLASALKALKETVGELRRQRDGITFVREKAPKGVTYRVSKTYQTGTAPLVNWSMKFVQVAVPAESADPRPAFERETVLVAPIIGDHWRTVSLASGRVTGVARARAATLGPHSKTAEPAWRSEPTAELETAETSPSLKRAMARGEAAKAHMVASGEMVTAERLADAWHITPQALSQAERAGKLFSTRVKGVRYYPRELLTLDREAVARVCKALQPLDAASMLIFWKASHGSLGGMTVEQALSGNNGVPQLARVEHLALATSAQARAAADDAASS